MVLSALPGEQLVLAAAAVPDSQVACLPPVPNERMRNWMIQMSDVRGVKFSFDLTAMAAQEGLLNCNLGCFSKIQQTMIDQIRRSMLLNQHELKSMLIPAKKIAYDNSTSTAKHKSATHLVPVGFTPQIVNMEPGLSTLTSATATLRYTDQASVFMSKGNSLSIKHGSMLVSAAARTTVLAGGYRIYLSAGSIALIANRGNHIIVRHIYSSSGAPATVLTADEKVVGAQVGQEVIVGRAGYSFARVLGEDAVGRRRMRHLDLGNNSNVITSEVSLVSLLENTDILSRLARSPAVEDKAIVGKILKTAVALSMVTQSHGAYSIVGR